MYVYWLRIRDEPYLKCTLNETANSHLNLKLGTNRSRRDSERDTLTHKRFSGGERLGCKRGTGIGGLVDSRSE